MRIFKRKKIRFVRYRSLFGFSTAPDETEQEYVDRKLKDVGLEMEGLREKIEILETVNKKNYVLIDPINGMWDEKEERWLGNYKAKIWVKENGYSYVHTFKENGELWVKEKEGKK